MRVASSHYEVTDIDQTLPLVPSQWQGTIALTIAKTARGTRLMSSSHKGPLYVQKAFYPEGNSPAHIYLLHPPGGMVSGDELSIDLRLKRDSQALFTTPGAGRIYRARHDRSLQQQNVCLRLEDDSSAEWFPLETIVFPNARGKLTTRVELGQNSRFIGWEISCLGLPASSKPFIHGEIKQRFEIVKAGRLQLLENFNINAEDRQLVTGKAGLQSKCVNGVLIAGPFDLSAEHGELMAALRSIDIPPSCLFASSLVGEFVVIRYLGDSAEQARQMYIECWRHLRPALLNREICQPRIWAT